MQCVHESTLCTRAHIVQLLQSNSQLIRNPLSMNSPVKRHHMCSIRNHEKKFINFRSKSFCVYFKYLNNLRPYWETLQYENRPPDVSFVCSAHQLSYVIRICVCFHLYNTEAVFSTLFY